MPDLNQSSPLVRELLLGEDGVIRHWTRAGARGWRLDVADELEEDLITDIKRVLTERSLTRCFWARCGRTRPTRSATASRATTCRVPSSTPP